MANKLSFADQVLTIAPPGYSDEEWAEHRRETDVAIRDGAVPPPVRIHDVDGQYLYRLEFGEYGWEPIHPPVRPTPSRPEVVKVSFVYFIGPPDGPVKIGEAVDPVARLSTLQTGYPAPISILATCAGGRAKEREYHRRFAEHRLHGEWFQRCPEIEAEIDRLNSEGAV